MKAKYKRHKNNLRWLQVIFSKYIVSGKLIFILMGITSTIWFLIRVIPKPHRASYPCMQAASPIMSGFILWILSSTTAVFTFKRAGQYYKNSRYLIGGIFLLTGIIAGVVSISVNTSQINATSLDYYTPNTPIGQAQGQNPGRVSWVWNSHSTNENMLNTEGDYWYENGNASQSVIDSMLSSGIRDLAGIQANTSIAWDSLFTWFNKKQNHGNHGYQPGEIIAIKLNLTNLFPSNVQNYNKTKDHERMDNAPELVFALLKQLVDVYGVNQEDIYIGDPYRAFINTYWNPCHSKFPDVHYVDGTGTNGREQTSPSNQQVLVFSDGIYKSSLPQYFLDATYLINMPSLKSHNATGFTLAAKNHQGSIIEPGTIPYNQTAAFMHYPMPYKNHNMKQYRHLVDFMGHKDLGEKTFLYIVDGIWGGRDWAGYIHKWDMLPFGGDYPSSIFLSQDAVAIESVIFDFMLEEFKDKPADEQFPYLKGVDDYLLQAADTSYWPNSIQYDPEGDGTVIGSLGVYEHWNNPIDKQYSRNLDTGDGIELVKVEIDYITGLSTLEQTPDYEINFYPNPVDEQITILIKNKWNGPVTYKLFDIKGRLIRTAHKDKFDETLTKNMNMMSLNSGLYILDVSFNGNHIKKKIQKK